MKENLTSKSEFLAPLNALAAADRFDALWRVAAAKGYPVAVWRLPGNEHPCLLINLSHNAEMVHPALEALSGGFLFTPFSADLSAVSAEEHPQSFYLKADVFVAGHEATIEVANNFSVRQQGLLNELLDEAVQHTERKVNYPYSTASAKGTLREQYEQLVAQSVAAIKNGEFQKNVCARTKAVTLPEGFRLENFFRALCAAYPNAFVSAVAIPGIGTWVGATPEILITVDKNQRFCTVALAGTQPKQPGMTTGDAVWRQKEIEEQAMVSRYIINCLKKIRVREFEEVGPRTVAAANLLHLRTDFTIDLQEVDFPNLPTAMLELLHPTSAVCGLPKEPAAAFLQQHEALDRSFFAGFLGPVNLQEETHLFVNLRCMQLFENSAMLYAGAGITADSVPEREWIETEHKCQTLLQVLNINSQ